ncbi:MAG: DUF4004 family protein [Clostridia bacterium]|nr:DUF4004 family protein [Clostridia bacterium]
MGRISKKDLLKKLDISYGQLYRWKREELIPDEWFIKVSVPSGQETYFDEELITERIDAIRRMKDKFRIDEIRSILNNNGSLRTYTIVELCKIRELNLDVLQLFSSSNGLELNDLVAVYMISKVVDAGIDIRSAEKLVKVDLTGNNVYVIGGEWVVSACDIAEASCDCVAIRYDACKSLVLSLLGSYGI